jgi:hypothetical protein
VFDFLRRDEPSIAAVHFAGMAPPPADGFARLRELGYVLTERRADDALWALGLDHPVHGSAELLAYRDLPPLDVAIRFAANLTEGERAAAMGSSSAVLLRVPATRKHILRDRKTMLRIARDVLGDDGVMVLDVTSQLPWSRASSSATMPTWTSRRCTASTTSSTTRARRRGRRTSRGSPGSTRTAWLSSDDSMSMSWRPTRALRTPMATCCGRSRR